MPCGKRPLVKTWDKPKNLRSVKPSRYERNEASVKLHWREVIGNLELLYKDDKFWETQRKPIQELVGPVIFARIAKIFDLPPDLTEYNPPSENVSRMESEQFYASKRTLEEEEAHIKTATKIRPKYSCSEFELTTSIEEEDENNETNQWSEDTLAESIVSAMSTSRKSLEQEYSCVAAIKSSRNFSRMISSKSFSRRNVTAKGGRSRIIFEGTSFDSPARSEDDMDVHLSSIQLYGHKHNHDTENPHYKMLYCNESETDMIKWQSKYKQKSFEVSASDEFSKRAEIQAKKIAKDFFDWWTALGSNEYKGEIKRAEDIESLFQVWFDEHASRCLKVDPRILPCVLQTIASSVREPQASCPRVLKRQIAYDLDAEKMPAHLVAFNTSLPHKLKHIPPNNNTDKLWERAKIPEDLRTMGAVWDDIRHLTSTKKFYEWLKQRYLPIPPCLEDHGAEKGQLFTVPSDYVTSGGSEDRGLMLPVSEYNFELKKMISKMMN